MVQALMRGISLVLFLLAVFATPARGMDRIRLWNRNYDNPQTMALLKLALDETRSLYGDYRIKSTAPMTQARAIRNLRTGAGDAINLVDAATDPKREHDLLAVRLPTIEGLLGYRVCLIAKGTESEFRDIKSYRDIVANHLVFGQGEDWPDTRILRANGLKVISRSRFQNLFGMLAHQRFNCFPRSVTEIYADLKRYGNAKLRVEPNLLFTYPLPSFFFVNKTNRRLAARIELGLRLAFLDGRYHRYLAQDIKPILNRLHLSRRRVIRLNNPLLTPATRKIATENVISTDGKLQIY